MGRRLTAVTRELMDAGFRRVYQPPVDADTPPPASADVGALARLKKGDRVKPSWVNVRRRIVQTPPLTEAALIHAMQARGIGRPSTYASAVETLIVRDYATRSALGELRSTERGRAVCGFLVSRFAKIFDCQFTARMERRLDDVAAGRSSYEAVLGEFWSLLAGQVVETLPPEERM